MAKRKPAGSCHGAVVIDKPAGKTSFQVMREVERRLGAGRAGHAGTLDPAATGVLLVLVGEGTKLSSLLMEHDKVYAATLALGLLTDTLDATGAVVATGPTPVLDEVILAPILAKFVGTYDQIPPAYSAIKKDGRTLMERARAGETDIPADPRKVVCHALTLRGLDPLRIDIHCGKGFYVRSLARDIAAALGTVGHLAALRRTRLGVFDIARAVAPEAVTDADVIPLAEASGLPTVVLDATDAAHVRAGRPLEIASAGGDVIALDQAAVPLAWLSRVGADDARYRVVRGFVPLP